MSEKLRSYWQLMRFHRPIGTLLLLWPTLWAVWLGGHGSPSMSIIIIFTTGVIIMRAAGCVINDIADRHIDGQVTRTTERPLASGKISTKHALILFFLLCLSASTLLFFLNQLCFILAVVAALLATIYPFIKRFSHFPQFVLGMAWSMGIPMAFAAQQNTVPIIGWLLYIATLCWTVAFDTMYGMVDRPDDLKIGVKSTAILFANYDRFLIGLFQIAAVFLLISIGYTAKLNAFYYFCLLIASFTALYQQYLIMDRTPSKCFQAFTNNHWFGAFVFLGIFLGT